MERSRSQIAIIVVTAVSAVVFEVAGDTPAATPEGTITQQELVRRTQELFDSVVPGNREPWKKLYAEDAIYSDEKGRSLNKAVLVADITPITLTDGNLFVERNGKHEQLYPESCVIPSAVEESLFVRRAVSPHKQQEMSRLRST